MRSRNHILTYLQMWHKGPRLGQASPSYLRAARPSAQTFLWKEQSRFDSQRQKCHILDGKPGTAQREKWSRGSGITRPRNTLPQFYSSSTWVCKCWVSDRQRCTQTQRILEWSTSDSVGLRCFQPELSTVGLVTCFWLSLRSCLHLVLTRDSSSKTMLK